MVTNWQMSCHQCPHVRIVVEPGPYCAGVEVVAFAEQVVQLRQLAVADDAVEQPQIFVTIVFCDNCIDFIHSIFDLLFSERFL